MTIYNEDDGRRFEVVADVLLRAACSSLRGWTSEGKGQVEEKTKCAITTV